MAKHDNELANYLHRAVFFTPCFGLAADFSVLSSSENSNWSGQGTSGSDLSSSENSNWSGQGSAGSNQGSNWSNQGSSGTDQDSGGFVTG